MANKALSLTTTEEVFNLTIEALCYKGNWAQTGDLTIGEEGKIEFAKGVLLDMIGSCIREHKLVEANAQIAAMQQQVQELIAAGNEQARQSVVMAVDGVVYVPPEPPPPEPEPEQPEESEPQPEPPPPEPEQPEESEPHPTP